MIQEAIVTKIKDNGLAEVVAERETMCSGDCDNCEGCKYDKYVKSLVKNPINAGRGQRVLIETPSANVISGAAIIYVIPIVLLFACYYAASLLGADEGLCALLSIAGAALGAYISAVLSKKRHRKDPTPWTIISVVSEDEK